MTDTNPRHQPASGARWAWARLNADALFIALLATGSGIFDLLDPTRDAVTAVAITATGAPHWVHYVRASLYVAVGLLLAGALLWSSVRAEVIARSVLGAAIGLNAYRHIVTLGAGDDETLAQLVLLGIVTLVTALRFSVLLDRRGLVVTRPAVDEGGPR